MHPEAREELSIRVKLTVLEYAKYFGATEACREFNVPRSSFYRWKQTYEQEGQAGLFRKKPIAYSHPRKTAPEVVEKFWNCGAPTESVPYGLRFIWNATRDQAFRVDRDHSVANPWREQTAKVR